jgi:hypothetical protein
MCQIAANLDMYATHLRLITIVNHLINIQHTTFI